MSIEETLKSTAIAILNELDSEDLLIVKEYFAAALNEQIEKDAKVAEGLCPYMDPRLHAVLLKAAKTIRSQAIKEGENA